MSVQDLGSIGELIAALATLATLIYLTFQVRQNTASVNSNNFNNAMQGFNAFNTQLMTDPNLTRILYDGNADPMALSEEERRQYVQMAVTIANVYRNLYYQFLGTSLPATYWEMHAREAKQIFSTPGGVYFRGLAASYEDLFQYLDTISDEEGVVFSEELWPRKVGQASPTPGERP